MIMTENRRRRVIAIDDIKGNVDNHAKNLDHNDDSDDDEYYDDDDDDDDSDYDSQYDEDEDDGNDIGEIIAENDKNDDDVDVAKITNVIEVESNVIKSNNDSTFVEQQIDNNRKERNYRRGDKDDDPTMVCSCKCC